MTLPFLFCLGNHVSHARTTVVIRSVSTLVAICSSLTKRRIFFQRLPQAYNKLQPRVSAVEILPKTLNLLG